MTKIKLGTRPKSFQHKVSVPLPGGEQGTIQWLFKYRTRAEFGKFVDDLIAQAQTAPPASQSDEDVRFSLAQAMEATIGTNADYILQIADGWNLDDEFNRANVVQLCDELPGVALATIEAYRGALTEGRLGN